jgi:2-isopropylmalate synthase
LRYEELGYVLSAAELDAAYHRFTELADRKKRIYDQDLIALLQTAAPANERMAAPAWGRASSAA